MNLFKKFDLITITSRIIGAFGARLYATARGGAQTSCGLDEIVRKCSASTRFVAAGATLSITQALHDGKVVKLDTLAGSVLTLPAATGSGMIFEAVVSAVATSNSHKIQVANAADFMIGTIEGVSDDPATVKGWIAANSGVVATNSDTITLNRTTTGSVSPGEYLVLQDFAVNTWLVKGMITQTGAEATPFSAAV
jgi:hypothetical protein